MAEQITDFIADKKASYFFELVKLGKTRAILEQTVFTETIFVLTKIYQISYLLYFLLNLILKITKRDFFLVMKITILITQLQK